MKKILALALSLMMALSCVAAFAETAEKESTEKQTMTMMGAFDIRYDPLPEYYDMVVENNDEMSYVAVYNPKEKGHPMLVLSISFSDAWSGVNTLADATEEDKEAIKKSFYETAELDEGDLEFSDAQTGLGTPLMVVKSKDDTLGALFGIYQSHEIEIDIFTNGEEGVKASDEIETLIKFLTDVEFVPVETAAK